MIHEEYRCNDCDAGPWSENALGSDGIPIVKFHRDLKHDVVECKEPTSKDIFEREIWNDKDRKNFKKSLREERLLKSGETS
ncbi:MAG TPA: hypothetical protein VIH04_02175 [Nitrosarchaeum sp.]